MKIELLSIEKLKPYEKNAKKHPKEQIEQIKNSILKFGNNDPIAVWGDNNIIVEGHGRYMALKQLGYKEVECIRLDHLTEEERKAYTLAHNKLTMNSDFDMDVLIAELEELQETDFDLSLTGFEMDELDSLLNVEDDFEKEVTEDDFNEELPEEPKAKLGDIYQLGKHRLMCGDSTNKDDVTKLIDGKKIDLVLTDPPYGISAVKNNKVGGGGWIKSLNYTPIKGDETTDTAKKFYNACIELGIENYILFGGNYFTDFLVPKACWIVWDKQINGNFADVELAWTSFDKGAKLYKWLWNGLCRKGERKIEGKSRVHPTQKPVGLIGEILKDFSANNDLILDCFGGSGTTLIACEQLNRTCYMMEYEPQYIDVIINRWETLTGQKAEKLNVE